VPDLTATQPLIYGSVDPHWARNMLAQALKPCVYLPEFYIGDRPKGMHRKAWEAWKERNAGMLRYLAIKDYNRQGRAWAKRFNQEWVDYPYTRQEGKRLSRVKIHVPASLRVVSAEKD